MGVDSPNTGQLVDSLSFFSVFLLRFFFVKSITMEISQLVVLSIALCCLAQFGEGKNKCYVTKSMQDPELVKPGGVFDKSKLRESNCPPNFSLCGSYKYYDKTGRLIMKRECTDTDLTPVTLDIGTCQTFGAKGSVYCLCKGDLCNTIR